MTGPPLTPVDPSREMRMCHPDGSVVSLWLPVDMQTAGQVLLTLGKLGFVIVKSGTVAEPWAFGATNDDTTAVADIIASDA